jgi:hypothetical protein
MLAAGWVFTRDHDGHGSPALTIHGGHPLYLRTASGVSDSEGDEIPCAADKEELTFMDIVWVPRTPTRPGYAALMGDVGQTHNGCNYFPFVVDYEGELSILKLSDRILIDDPSETWLRHGSRTTVTIDATAALAAPPAPPPSDPWVVDSDSESSDDDARELVRVTDGWMLGTHHFTPRELAMAEVRSAENRFGNKLTPAERSEAVVNLARARTTISPFVSMRCRIVDDSAGRTISIPALRQGGWDFTPTGGMIRGEAVNGPVLTIGNSPRYYLKSSRLADDRLDNAGPVYKVIVREPGAVVGSLRNVLLTEGTELAEQREAPHYLFTLANHSIWSTILMADSAMLDGAPSTPHVGLEGTITIRGWPYMLDEFHPVGSERSIGGRRRPVP